MNMPGSCVSIIIPNYNGEALLKKNLPAVLEASKTYGRPAEIIVVDDASTDKSVDLITTRFPSVKLVRQEINKGFADTVHTGIQHAIHEYLILLNSDVRPYPDFIAPLLTHFKNPSIFAVSPLVCSPDGTPQTVSWNLGIIKRGSIKFRSWDMKEAKNRVEKGQTLKSLFASGGSVALRKTMFKKLGGFLPLYKPFYYEDVDLCTRAWFNGWETLFEPQSRVIHNHEGVIRKHFDARRIRTIRLRNRFFFLWLYLSRKGILASHVPGIAYRLLFRTLQLDMTYLIALAQAGFCLRQIVSVRSLLRSRLNSARPLEMILLDIEQTFSNSE